VPIENAPGPQNVTTKAVQNSVRVPQTLKEQAVALLGKAEATEPADTAAYAKEEGVDLPSDGAVSETVPGAVSEVAAETEAAPSNGVTDKHAKARAEAAKRAAEFERNARALAADREAKLKRQQEEAAWAAQQAANKTAFERAQLASQDPLRYLETANISPEEIVKRAIASQDPNAKLLAEIAELKKWKDDQARQAQTAQQQWEAQQKTQSYVNARKHLEGLVDKTPEAYPTLANLPPDYVSYKAYNIALQCANDSGEVPDPEKVLAYLDKLESDLVKSRQKGRTVPAATSQAPVRAVAKKAPAASPSINGRASTRDERKNKALAVLDRFKDDE
jgi:hypothetical protein